MNPNPLDLLLAFALIITHPEKEFKVDYSIQLSASLTNIAIRFDILDKEKNLKNIQWFTGYMRYDEVFFEPEIFENQLIYYRGLFQDYRNFPQSCNQIRLPSHDICSKYIKMNYEYQKYLEDMRQFTWNKDSIEVALEECRKLQDFWQNAQYAVGSDNILWIREYLQNMRNAIGDRDFYAGTWPNPIPVWSIPYDQYR